MKVSIVVFSPSGNTLRTAAMLREELKKRSTAVQLLDLTRNGRLFEAENTQSLLEELVDEHEVLCVGGPVYAHHLHYNVLRIISSLPRPFGKWGRIAIPFVTYGTISSGISLREAAAALRRSGRITPFAMKAEAFHCMSRLLLTKVGEGLPDARTMPVIENLADHIVALEKGRDCSSRIQSFDYQDCASRIKARLIFREKLWHSRIYPGLTLARGKCKLCSACIVACPVQRLRIADGALDIAGQPACIHCGQCVVACPASAISFNCDFAKWDDRFARAAKGKGLMPSHEKPKSAVYPLRSPHH